MPTHEPSRRRKLTIYNTTTIITFIITAFSRIKLWPTHILVRHGLFHGPINRVGVHSFQREEAGAYDNRGGHTMGVKW
jgi:hypothetical protein